MRVAILVVFLAASPLFGSILFSDYSESGSSSGLAWTVDFGEEVNDSLNPASGVLHFTGFGSRADLLSMAIPYVSLYAPASDVLQVGSSSVDTYNPFCCDNDQRAVSLYRAAYPGESGLGSGSWQEIQLLFSFSP